MANYISTVQTFRHSFLVLKVGCGQDHKFIHKSTNGYEKRWVKDEWMDGWMDLVRICRFYIVEDRKITFLLLFAKQGESELHYNRIQSELHYKTRVDSSSGNEYLNLKVFDGRRYLLQYIDGNDKRFGTKKFYLKTNQNIDDKIFKVINQSINFHTIYF